MKKISPSLSIILSTIISVTIMVSYSSYAEGKVIEQVVVHYNKGYIQSRDRSNDNDVKVVIKGQVEAYDTKEYLQRGSLPRYKLNDEFENRDEKGDNNSNTSLSNEKHEKVKTARDAYNEMHSRLENNSLEDYYSNQIEQSVFKVATGKIMDKLTIYDKVRLLYASMQLGKENYKKVEAYLYADNAEAGVLKALKLLREKLSEKEYKKVRKVAEKFIDMDAAEGLY